MRKFLLIALTALLLASCVYQSPFKEEALFSSMGGDGDVVVTIDARRVKEGALSSILPSSVLIDRSDRISVSIGRSVYGALEGNFGYAIVDAALAWSPDWKLMDEDDRYYRSRSSGLEAAVPVSGVLLFSSESYRDAQSRLIDDRRAVISPVTSALMESSLAALYTRSAEAAVGMGIGITEDVADNIDEMVFLFDEKGAGLVLSGWIDMDSSSSARALVTVLRNELLKSIRERGERPDFAALSSYYTQDGDKVILAGIDIDAESVRGILSRLEVF